jgi:hypothetical protein
MWLSQIFCIMGWLGIAFAKVFPPSFDLLLCFDRNNARQHVKTFQKRLKKHQFDVFRAKKHFKKHKLPQKQTPTYNLNFSQMSFTNSFIYAVALYSVSLLWITNNIYWILVWRMFGGSILEEHQLDSQLDLLLMW